MAFFLQAARSSLIQISRKIRRLSQQEHTDSAACPSLSRWERFSSQGAQCLLRWSQSLVGTTYHQHPSKEMFCPWHYSWVLGL